MVECRNLGEGQKRWIDTAEVYRSTRSGQVEVDVRLDQITREMLRGKGLGED